MALARLILLILISLRLLGGDCGVLQMVAWGGMLVSRAPEQGLAAALESTFDGAHPCSLCTAISTSKKSPPPETPVDLDLLVKLKLKNLICSQDPEVESPPETSAVSTVNEMRLASASARRDSPPVPPPRTGKV